jgi:hypothetical protein
VCRYANLKHDQRERDGKDAIGDADNAPARLYRWFERSFHAASPALRVARNLTRRVPVASIEA